MKCRECDQEAIEGITFCQKHREMKAIRAARYYSANKEKVAARKKRYEEQNREKVQKRTKLYRENNVERIKEIRRNHYIKNRDRLLVENRNRHAERYRDVAKLRYETNKDKIRDRIKEWHKNNPDKRRFYHSKRYAKKHGSYSTNVNPEFVYNRDKWICQICGIPVDTDVKYPHPHYPTLDHIIPLIKGGWHREDNLQCTHLRCNISKSSKMPNEISQALIPVGTVGELLWGQPSVL